MSRFSAALAAALLAASAAAFAEPLTPRLLATLDRVDDPRVSPDGHYALYDLRTVDYDANRASHSLWVVDLKTHASRRLKASDGGATNGRWAPDGSILFLSGRAGGINQVFRTDLGGETAVQVTRSDLEVAAYRLSPDGKTLIVALAVYPDCPDIACTVQRKKAHETALRSGIAFDRLFVRHWDAWADGTRNHLFAWHLDASGIATGAPVALMNGFDGDAPARPFGGDGDFTISPDGKTVVFAAKLAGVSEPWSTNFDLYAVPVDGSRRPENLTASNLAWDGSPAFSPDGKWLVYSAMSRPGFEADRFRLMLRNLASGETREVAPGWDRTAEAAIWSRDGKRLLVATDDLGQRRLFAIDPSSGRVTALTGRGHVGAFDAGPNGVVFAADTILEPAQLFAVGFSGRPAVRLTAINAAAMRGVSMGRAEQFSFAGWNGERVYGYIVRPADFDPARRYPIALLIHGGPQGSMANEFHYRWNPQIYAGAGYVAVTIDFHGSTGYGQAFTDSISRHWGDRPLEDLQKGWAYVLAHYAFADGNRACALGASYGGFMVNWIAGNWNAPFKCFVSHDGEVDTRSMGITTDELWFDEWERGGTPWEVPENYARFNPFDHVRNWSKPMLIVHGGRDYRIDLSQGLGAFTILQRRGIPSRFLYFPDENHWVVKPQNSVQWHEEVLAWLKRWTGE